MIEWEGYLDPRTGLRFHSLYGERREPSPESLREVDRLVFDIPEVGARYYTFIWTLALCMKACEALGIPVTVLDRPNPIDGKTMEGGVLDPEFASFVGLYPIPVRHGQTMGGLARYFQARYFPRVELEVVDCEGWDRARYLDETEFPWVMPSPNMPSVQTALVYPGMCLLEGTRMSEGRGTTRPFEMLGAPFIDAWRFCEALQKEKLPGVWFRPATFLPTFQKHAGTLCQGCFVHVTDRRKFESVLTGVAVIRAAASLYPGDFAWLPPPYEYETEKLPFDILAGNAWLRESIEQGEDLGRIRERLREELSTFCRKESSYPA